MADPQAEEITQDVPAAAQEQTTQQVIQEQQQANADAYASRRPSRQSGAADNKSKSFVIGPDVRKTVVDVLNTEYIYYSAVLRTYTPSLSQEYDKMTTHLWIKKLFGPEYHSTVLKPKRNKYLLYLIITIYNDETYGIFRQEPPCGVLPEIKDIAFEKNFPLAAWEAEKQWSETLSDLPDDIKISECYLHQGCPESNRNVRAVLDSQFQFYLWLSRPYVSLLTDPEDKTKAAGWIQILCGIAAEESDCVEMKELRNEYMEALLGYIHDLRVEGPFRLMPPFGPIPRLAMFYEECDPKDADANGKEAEEFLSSQPLPEEGAFAYINVTGQLFG